MSDRYFCRDCKAKVGAEQYLSDDLPECSDCRSNDIVPVNDMTNEDCAEYAEAELDGR